jgi:hypothetical protein
MTVPSPPPRSLSALYSAPVERFLAADPAQVLGTLAAANAQDLEAEQKRAWEDEIRILQGALSGFAGWLHLEFDVPRLGR